MVKIREQSQVQFKEHYEKEAQVYDKVRSTSLMGVLVDRLQVEFIAEEIECLKKEDFKVLEAGCGTGRILIPLAEKGINIYGVDPAINMLAVLKNKIGNKNLAVELKEGDIENIPYPDNTFDVVYTMHVLMHMSIHKKAISEMYRILKPRGKMIMDFPNKSSPYTAFSIVINQKKKRTHLFTKKDLKKLFKSYNYKITGLFSYSKAIYKIPLIRRLIYLVEKYIKLPVCLRSQLFVIVKK